MNYKDLFRNSIGGPAKNEIIVVGINPLSDFLINNTVFIADLLKVSEKLSITIIYENDTENFNQSLFYDEKLSKNEIDLVKIMRLRKNLLGNENKKGGLLDNVSKLFEENERKDIRQRIKLFQNNLRHFVNIVFCDDIIYYCFTTLEIPSVDMYQAVTKESNDKLFTQLYNYIKFLLNNDTGGLYLSQVDDELIQLYDNDSYPRGIYPRKAFYSTDYQRYSIWAFIFNRKGELLLHKRSEFTADNRSLWDKSAGGHVDLKDYSTVLTAKREVVEELFMPEAEHTLYMTEKIRDFIDFGEWDTQKRPEIYFKSDFDGLDSSDWVVFRPIDRETGLPMTIRRKSPRIMHIPDLDLNGNKIPILDKDGNVKTNVKGRPIYKEHKEVWHTRFISDVYLFIAPSGYLDTNDQMNSLMALSETRGAASAHQLISTDKLIKEIKKSPQLFTDDLYYMMTEKRWLLTEFSEFIKYIFDLD